MPCQSDHMEHNPREIESSLVAELLVYTKGKLRQKVSEDIKDAAGSYYGNVKHLDEWTAELCSLCSGFSKEQEEKIIYNGRNAKSRSLADWWDRHKSYDKKRKSKEKQDKKNEKLRESALSKLTAEEREALNLK